MGVTGTLEPQARSIRTLAPARGTALDIGANHGVYSYFMVRHFDRVVAFEPQPACVQTLRSWAKGRVEIRQVALSDREGYGQLAIPVKAGVPLTGYARLDAPVGDTSSQLPVSVERLDDQGIDNVRFVKIDVEGHELEVLRGGDVLLRRDHPILLVEIEQRHLGPGHTITEVVTHLADRGYDCFFRVADAWTEFGEFSLESHQDVDQVGKPGYVNMFLFRPRGS
jgi:FkbM family methyltransferase